MAETRNGRRPKRRMTVPTRPDPEPGGGFRFGNLAPATARQLLHVWYARMYKHNLETRGGLRPGRAARNARELLLDLEYGEKHVEAFSAITMEKRKDDRECAYCGRPADSKDHLIPRMRNGPEAAENVVQACRSCNSSKGSRDVFEWAASKGFFPLEIVKRYVRLAWRWCDRNGLLDRTVEELRAAHPPFVVDIDWRSELPIARKLPDAG